MVEDEAVEAQTSDRMNAAEQADELMVFTNGKITFHPLFVQAPVFKDVVPLFERSQQRAQDLGNYIYLMYHGRSPYRNTEEGERQRLFFHEGRCGDAEWLKGALEDERVTALIDYYCTVGLSQGQRLFMGLVKNVKRFIDELSDTKASDGTDLTKRVEQGKKLYQTWKDIEQMVQEQGQRKVKSGYEVGRFERRPASTLSAST